MADLGEKLSGTPEEKCMVCGPADRENTGWQFQNLQKQ